MSSPISPPPVHGGGRNELPAYVANGVMGLRVREMPLAAGLTLLSGYSGEHPQRRIEAIAVAPYPVAGDIQLEGVWLSDATHAVTVVDQAYDFETGELTSRFEFDVAGRKARVEVLVFCSRDEPSLVCQEITVELDKDSDLALKSVLDARHVDGARCVTSAIRLARTSRAATLRPCGKVRARSRPVAWPTSRGWSARRRGPKGRR